MAVTLFLNLVLLDHAFRPLDELRRLMQTVDPLAPGRRLEIGRADEDVKALTDAFNAMLDRIETERRESARRALAAQEQERQRMARELHDELGQILTGVLLLMDEASKASPERAREVLEEAREAARGSIEDVRRIVRDLRPEALDDLGLASALAALAASFERHTDIRLERNVPLTLPDLEPETELVIYRVAQEALTNVTRHSGAARAALDVRRVNGQLEVAVRDDGGGFAGDAPAEGGLQGMRERALLVRGSVTVSSRVGYGTEIRLVVPLERDA
jgi:two-component system sensor histidine kinase UhpB